MIDHHKLEEFRGAEINVQYPEVLPLDMVDKSTSLSKTIWDWVFDRLQSREAFSSLSEGHPSSLLALQHSRRGMTPLYWLLGLSILA